MIHSAYTFSPTDFNAQLVRQLTIRHELFELALHTQAVSTVRNASETTLEVLKRLRFDVEILSTTGKGDSPLSFWYAICLAPYLKVAPSLSGGRCYSAHEVLKRILPILKWGPVDIDQLIYGRPLSEIVQLGQETILISKIRALDQFGGWLPLDSASEVLTRLKEVERCIRAPTPEMVIVLGDIAKRSNTNPDRLIGDSFDDLTLMLKSALDQKGALYLIAD
jgi:hypothetical protein